MSKKFGNGTCKSTKYDVASDGMSNRKRSQSSSRRSSTSKVKSRNKKVRVEYIDIGSHSEDSDDSGKSSESKSSWTSSSHSSYSSSGSEQFRDSSPEDVKQLKKKKDRRVNVETGRKKGAEDSKENDTFELEHEEFCVEKILDMKVEPSGTFYFVKWLNYDESDNTWEPEDNLEKCQDVIEEYLAEQKKKLVAEPEPESHVKTSKSTERKQKKPANLTGRSKKTKISRERINDMDGIKNKIKRSARKVVTKYKPSPSSFSLITPDASRSPSSTMEVDTPSPTKSFDSVDSDFDSRSSIGSIENDLPPRSNTNSSSEDLNILTPCRSSPSPVLANPENHVSTNEDLDSLKALIKPSEIVRLRQPGNLFYFRIIKDGKIDWLYVDIDEGGRSNAVNSDELYRCVVTEDLTGKDPKLIYGATKGNDGEIFCLVQFEGCSYVDVIPPQNLFQKYPSFKRFFEMHCPRIFPKEELSKF